MIAATCDAFTEYLQAQLELADLEVPEQGEWANVGNTTGAFALRLGLLRVEQIAQILESQENSQQGNLFGEIAIEFCFVQQVEIDLLLQLHPLNRRLELVLQLVSS